MTVTATWSRGLLALTLLLLLLTGCTQEGEREAFALNPMEMAASATGPEGGTVRMEISIPQVSGEGADRLQKALNEYFQERGNETLRTVGGYLGGYGMEPTDEVTVEWTYDIKRNDGRWLSVLHQGIAYTANTPYPNASLRSDNLQVVDGALQPILLEEAFDLTPEEAQAYLVDQLEVLGEGAYDRADLNASFDFRNFYLTGDSLVLYYQEGQLGPHALGTPEFRIPFTELSEVLKQGALPN